MLCRTFSSQLTQTALPGLRPAPSIFLQKNRVKTLFPLRRGPYAGSGRALPCTRDFFAKKSSKNLISAAAGNGCALSLSACCPAHQKDGGRGDSMRNYSAGIILIKSQHFAALGPQMQHGGEYRPSSRQTAPNQATAHHHKVHISDYCAPQSSSRPHQSQ